MYTLHRASYIVRKTYDSEGGNKVFETILHNNRIIRYVHSLYVAAPGPAKAVLIVLYGLKCYLALGWMQKSKGRLAFFGPFPNERQILQHVRQTLGKQDHGEFTISLRHCLKLRVFADLLAYLSVAVRLLRYARRLAARHSFMPACRIFITVAYYMKFKRILGEGDAKGVFISSQYSSECLGLAAAAHQTGRKVLFVNHANAARDTGYIAPHFSDLLAVTNQSLADIYRAHSPGELEIVPFPIATPQRQMSVANNFSDELVVGIYLTGLTNEERLQEVVEELGRLAAIKSIFIRMHPVQIVNPDLSSMADGQTMIDISINRPLEEDIERTDIAVCGNSTVTIELLRYGKPVLYETRLDHYIPDHHGFAERGLVPAYPDVPDDTLIDQISRFYECQDWPETMRYFDSSYQQDEEAMLGEFRKAVDTALQ